MRIAIAGINMDQPPSDHRQVCSPEKISVEDFSKTMAINVEGPLFLTKATRGSGDEGTQGTQPGYDTLWLR